MPAQRRSARIRNASNHSSQQLNGSHLNHNGNRSSTIHVRSDTNSNSSPLNNGHRYSGQKRRNIDPPSDASDNDSSTDSDNNHSNSNTHQHKRRRLSQPQQSIQASSQSQSQSTQTKFKPIRYVMDKDKWTTKQTAIQRRSTRMKYRHLADETKDNRAQIVDPMNDAFLSTLVEQNEIYSNVCHPNEAFMDIEQAKNMTNLLKEQTRSLANEQFTITPNDYISAICRDFGEPNAAGEDADDEDEERAVRWDEIGQKFALWFLTVPPIQFMNGPLQQSESGDNKAKKPRQVRQKKTFTTDAPRIEPKKVVKQKKADKTETKSRVAHLRKVLRKACTDQDGVNPFEFLINPVSYSQTIENLFDLSFIMNQGFAQMAVSQGTEQPVLSYVSSADRLLREKESNAATNANGQCIIKFNPSTFVNLIDVYQIQQSQIERADQRSDDKDNNNDNDAEEEESTEGEDEDAASANVKIMNGYCNGKEEAD